MSRRGIGWLLFLVFCCSPALLLAQTLAHKGWVGSGLTVDPWWKNAVFYQLDPLAFQLPPGEAPGALNGVTQHLEYLQSLGVDAIVLSPFQLHTAAQGAAPAFDPVYGTADDFDKLSQAASLRKMRLIADLPLGTSYSAEDTLAIARFWLSRGVGGLRLVGEPAQNGNGGTTLGPAELSDRVRQLRRLCSGYMGDRVLVWDVVGAPAPGDATHPLSARRGDLAPDEPQLKVNAAAAAMTTWNAASLRALVSGTASPNTVVASDLPDGVGSWARLSVGSDRQQRLAIAKMLATALFTGREAPMLLSGQELGIASNTATPSLMPWLDKFREPSRPNEPEPPSDPRPIESSPGETPPTVASEDADPGSLLNWYRTLSQLRRQGFALKGGTAILLDTGYPEVVAWVRKGATAGERPVLIMCNLSGRGVLISVGQQLTQLGLKPASGMMPIALSFSGVHMSYTATGIDLPPYGIYLGEILQPGLEEAPAPRVSHKRGR